MTPADAAACLRALVVPGSPGRVLLHRRDERVAEIVLDHPAARNALSTRMMADLADIVVELLAAPPTAVVLRASTPGAFCAGGYLVEVADSLTEPGAGRTMCEGMTAALDALFRGPFVSVAVVEGPAVGGGAELALAADFRVWSSGGRLAFRQAALGVAAGWGGAARLRELVGRREALRLLCQAATVDPATASALGLADVCVQERAVDAAYGWLEQVFAQPGGAVRACKQQVVAAGEGDVCAATDAFVSVWGGADHRDLLSRAWRKSQR